MEVSVLLLKDLSFIYLKVNDNCSEKRIITTQGRTSALNLINGTGKLNKIKHFDLI